MEDNIKMGPGETGWRYVDCIKLFFSFYIIIKSNDNIKTK
jgi:hypothetical protein